MKQLFKQIWLIAIALVVGMPAFAETPAIKVGEAEVTFTLNFPENFKLDNPTAKVLSMSMFESEGDIWAENPVGTELKYDGKSFKGRVPLQLEEEWIYIRIEEKESGLNNNLLTLVSQSKPTNIEMNFSLSQPQPTVVSSNAEYSKLNWMDWYTLSSIAQFMPNNPAYEREGLNWPENSAYKSWETVEKAYWGKMYPDRMKYIIDFSKCGDLYENAPAWVKNSSKWWFAAKYVMDYVEIAKMKNNLTVAEPPIEFYSFLSKIDFSNEFLMHFPLQPQKVILDKILGIKAAGIKAIGDTPVKEWQAGVREALIKAFEPTDLLLDLLAAQSYVNQIVEDNKPLTAAQIENVKQGFNNDLGKIILNRNEKK